MSEKKTKKPAKENKIERKTNKNKDKAAYGTIYGGYPGAPKSVDELEDQNSELAFLVWEEYLSTTPKILRNLVKERMDEEKKRTGKKITQEQIAEEIGVSKQTFSQWLSDKYEGRYREKNLCMLADYFHVQVEYLKCEQIERVKDESISPERIKSLNLERYLKTLGFSFHHGYGMDLSLDPNGVEDPYGEYEISNKKEVYVFESEDENGNKSIKRRIVDVPTFTYPYGKPLMITFPSGHKVLVRENTFDKYCGEFEEWIEFVLGKLLEHASNDDISMGTIPADIINM